MNQTISDFFDEPGPVGRRRMKVVTVVGVLAFVAILVWMCSVLASKGQFDASKWTPFLEASTWRAYYIPGIIGTLKAAAVAIIFANVLGVVLGMARLAQSAPVRVVAGVLVEFFRAVPVLILMLFFYFLFANVLTDPSVAPFWGVVCGLTIYNASVIAELVASGVSNLPGGQREAGLAIGMTSGMTLRQILLPQALIAMMPSMIAQLVIVLKDTALGYTITYFELLNRAKTFGSAYQNYLPALFVAALIFIAINMVLGWLARFLSRKLESETGLTIRKKQPEPRDDLFPTDTNAEITHPVDDPQEAVIARRRRREAEAEAAGLK